MNPKLRSSIERNSFQLCHNRKALTFDAQGKHATDHVYDSDTGTREYSKTDPIRRKWNLRDAKLPDMVHRQRSSGSTAQGEGILIHPKLSFSLGEMRFCYWSV
jgi:hypothetical protein